MEPGSHGEAALQDQEEVGQVAREWRAREDSEVGQYDEEDHEASPMQTHVGPGEHGGA